MEHGAIPRVITKMAIPAVIGMIVMSVYNMADTYFVGLMPNATAAQGAVSVMYPVLMLTQAVCMWIATGAASYISRKLGEKDGLTATRIAGACVLLELLAGAVIAVLGILFVEPILTIFSTSRESMDLAKQYAVVMLSVAPIQMMCAGLHNMLRAEGSAFRSMIGMSTGAILNIAIDPLFIFTFHMGVSGAAVATGISQAVCFVILISSYIRKKTVVRLSMGKIGFSKRILGEICKSGLPMLATQLLMGVSMGVINFAAGQAALAEGGDPTGAITAFGIVNRIMVLSTCAMFGFAQGFQPVAGYNYGARYFGRLKQAVVFSITVELAIGAVILLCGTIFSRSIVACFTPDPYVLEVGERALFMNALSAPFSGFIVLMTALYQALGKARGAMVMSICRQGLCLMPLLFLLPSFFGLFGVMLSPFIADSMTMALSIGLAVGIFRGIAKNMKENGEPGETTTE